MTHVPDRDFDTLRAAGNISPTGIWSDGTTIWVADYDRGHTGRDTRETVATETKTRARSALPVRTQKPRYGVIAVVPGRRHGSSWKQRGEIQIWYACLDAGGCGNHIPDDMRWGRGNRPVMNVSWEDAQSYVRWLSARTGKTYRLLSESEWEYVARTGTETAYSWVIA